MSEAEEIKPTTEGEEVVVNETTATPEAPKAE